MKSKAADLEWSVNVEAMERARILRGWTRRDVARQAHVDEGTDGQLRHSDVDHLTGLVKAKRSSRTELLIAGLWLETVTGFEVVGFLDHNKSKVERQKAAADAKARYEDWLRRHANDVYSAVSNDVGNPFVLSNREPEKQRTREAEQAAIVGSVA